MSIRCMRYLLITLVAVWLAACGHPSVSTPELYRPPAPAGILFTPEPTIPSIVPTDFTTPNLECLDNLHFLDDITIPDGSRVQPGEEIDKRWLVENNGSCNWDVRYRLKLIAGDSLGAQAEQALYPARSGAQITMRILFIAPLVPGAYRSAWQAFSPQGEPFGDPIFIEIVVESP